MENLIFSAILYLVPVLFFYCPIVKGLHSVVKRDRSQNKRLNNIPFANHYELITLAEEYNIRG